MDTILKGGSKTVSQIMDLHGFSENWGCSRVPSTPTTKNYAGNEVSRPKSIPRKKMFFLQKKFFRNIFHFFRHLNISIFAILPIWGCVRPYQRPALPSSLMSNINDITGFGAGDWSPTIYLPFIPLMSYCFA